MGCRREEGKGESSIFEEGGRDQKEFGVEFEIREVFVFNKMKEF